MQLHRLRPRLGDTGGRVVWITFDTPHSRSLLDGEEVVFARYTGSRDPAGVLINQRLALRMLDRLHVTAVVSTGAAIALSFMPLARARGIPCHFIESAARSEGPSLTGRLLTALPGVCLYTQYRSWEGGRWHYAGSVFDGFEAVERPRRRVRRVVVTLGTTNYPFRRLLERLVRVLPSDAEVLWQTGATDTNGLGIEAVDALPFGALEAAMRDADVVVAHSGAGAALSALEAGRIPLLVPRRRAHYEHVDDHQRQIAEHLSATGLALARDADDLGMEDLERAAGLGARKRDDPPPFDLAG